MKALGLRQGVQYRMPPSVNFKRIQTILGWQDKQLMIRNCNLEEVVADICSFAEQIWLAPVLYDYVDHGVEHSIKVLQFAVNVFQRLTNCDVSNASRDVNGWCLSDLEKTVLACAALIHDIGMQYEQFRGDNVVRSPGEIRNEHHVIGRDMISDIFAGKSRGLPAINTDNIVHRNIIAQAAIVACAHRGDLPSGRDSYYISGEEIRIGLLCGLLRVGDELDCDMTRVLNAQRLLSASLGIEERRHWLACLYVNNVYLSSAGSGFLEILLQWCVPQNCNVEVENLIRELLTELRIRKMEAEFQRIAEAEYFKFGGNELACVLHVELARQPSRNVSAVTLDVESLRHIIGSGSSNRQYMPRDSNLGHNQKHMSLAKEIATTAFNSGKIVSFWHHSLGAGWHTDTYIDCRQLCSDVTFRLALCYGLANGCRNSGISDVIANGSGAIMLGGYLGLLLQARSLYTFDSGSCPQPEWLLSFPNHNKERKVLIVVDTLANGTVVRNIVSRLGKVLSGFSVLVFAIFRLGTDALADLDDYDVTYLAHYPQVAYYSEEPDGSCEKCRRPGVASLRKWF